MNAHKRDRIVFHSELTSVPSKDHFSCQSTMCNVTAIQTAPPRIRWYWTAASNGTPVSDEWDENVRATRRAAHHRGEKEAGRDRHLPNAAVHTLVLVTGKVTKDISRVVTCPVTRAAMCRPAYASL